MLPGVSEFGDLAEQNSDNGAAIVGPSATAHRRPGADLGQGALQSLLFLILYGFTSPQDVWRQDSSCIHTS